MENEMIAVDRPGAGVGDDTTRTRRFFIGPGLPVFLLAATAAYEAFLLALVFAPEGAGWWGVFAQEFRVWRSTPSRRCADRS